MTMSKGPSYFYRAKVISVYDGDTCRADIDVGFGVVLRNKTIRLSGIDTAEMRGEEKEEATKARDRLRELILEKEVVLQTIKDRTGKYGRVIGTIYVDGKNVNDTLVEEGLAIKIAKKRRRRSNTKKEQQPTEKKEQQPTEKKEQQPTEKKEQQPTEKRKTPDSDVAVKIVIPDTVLQSVSSSSED